MKIERGGSNRRKKVTREWNNRKERQKGRDARKGGQRKQWSGEERQRGRDPEDPEGDGFEAGTAKKDVSKNR